MAQGKKRDLREQLWSIVNDFEDSVRGGLRSTDHPPLAAGTTAAGATAGVQPVGMGRPGTAQDKNAQNKKTQDKNRPGGFSGGDPGTVKYLQVVFNRPLENAFSYILPENLAEAGHSSLVGRRVQALLGRSSLTGFVVGESHERPQGLPDHVVFREIERVIDDQPVFNAELVELAQWMAQTYVCSQGEAISHMIPGGRNDIEIPALPVEVEGFSPESVEPSDEQRHAVNAICTKKSGSFYLYGITGSGKTEVFLRAAEKTLEEGRGIIYLVPEISLTHQVVDFIRLRFGDRAAILHSELSPSQRIAEWRKILLRESRLVIGARSAVFAPMDDIGLIVIDEEHEGSYKSGSTPRYHARQVAMHRASTQGARLVMGSATPSVEAWYHMHRGSLEKLQLSRRLSGGALPTLRIVNMRGVEGSLSGELQGAIRGTLDQGRQVILFLNRRGFGSFYHCRSCGGDFSCTRCSVSLTYHKASNRMVCHHCGYNQDPESACPECGSLDLGFSNFGTEKVESDLAHSFPNAETRRLDTDIARKKGELEKTIREFRAGTIDILLGTQMVAKGLNFPGVKLVGIILADAALHLPDFRSYERSFSLITQVAGRAGRYHADGQVIIQSLNSTHHVIRMAAENRIEDFYRKELESRKALRFPPFSRVMRLVVRGKDSSQVWNIARRLSDELRNRFASPGPGQEANYDFLGPAESPIWKLNNNFRVHLMILGAKLGPLQSWLPGLLLSLRLPRGIYVEVDVDPQSLL